LLYGHICGVITLCEEPGELYVLILFDQIVGDQVVEVVPLLVDGVGGVLAVRGNINPALDASE